MWKVNLALEISSPFLYQLHTLSVWVDIFHRLDYRSSPASLHTLTNRHNLFPKYTNGISEAISTEKSFIRVILLHKLLQWRIPSNILCFSINEIQHERVMLQGISRIRLSQHDVIHWCLSNVCIGNGLKSLGLSKLHYDAPICHGVPRHTTAWWITLLSSHHKCSGTF